MSDVVIFDGLCNLCSHSVQFILRHEASPEIRFASLQSTAGARLLRQFDFDPHDTKSFVLLSGGKAYIKSAAAIRIARQLRGAWKWLAVVRMVPPPVRDYVYDVVARHRYRWFGQRQTCMVPTAELAARFLSQ